MAHDEQDDALLRRLDDVIGQIDRIGTDLRRRVEAMRRLPAEIAAITADWQPEVVGPMAELRDAAIDAHRRGETEPMDDLMGD